MSTNRPARLSIGVMACSAKAEYLAQLRACEETWAPECRAAGVPVFYFDGEAGAADAALGPAAPFTLRLPGVGDTYESASAKQWGAFRALPEVAPADFYLVVGTDNYVWAERALAVFEKYDPAKPWAVGGFQQSRIFQDRYWVFPLGGGGVALSRGAVAAFAPHFAALDEAWRREWPASFAAACDVAFAVFAERLRVPLVREYDLHACSWLYRYKNPDRVNVGPVDYDRAAVFHYMDPWDLRAYHALRADAATCRALHDAAARFPGLVALARTLPRAVVAGDPPQELRMAFAWGALCGRLDALAALPAPDSPLAPASVVMDGADFAAGRAALARFVRFRPEDEIGEETAADHHLVILTAKADGAREAVEARLAEPKAWSS